MVCAPHPKAARYCQELQRVTWFLRHGNVFRARPTVHDLTTDIGIESGKLAKSGP